MLSQNERILRLQKLNTRKLRQDYQSYDEWHKQDKVFAARDEFVRAEQLRKSSVLNKLRCKKNGADQAPASPRSQ